MPQSLGSPHRSSLPQVCHHRHGTIPFDSLQSRTPTVGNTLQYSRHKRVYDKGCGCLEDLAQVDTTVLGEQSLVLQEHSALTRACEAFAPGSLTLARSVCPEVCGPVRSYYSSPMAGFASSRLAVRAPLLHGCDIARRCSQWGLCTPGSCRGKQAYAWAAAAAASVLLYCLSRRLVWGCLERDELAGGWERPGS